MTQTAKMTVLVVDDTPQNIEVLEELLRPHYRVQVALNGQRALTLAHGSERPDLILLDVMMPEMDGHEVCRRLKSDARSRDIPVIFVTARTEPEDEIAGFRDGAVDYIHKPISPPTVLARVKNHLTLAHTKKVLEGAVIKRTRELQASNRALEAEVRQREEAMNRAEHLSQFDQLTGLPNRRQLQERLRHELERAKLRGLEIGLIRLNFDRMQALNNSFGPSTGDAALALGTRRLQNALEPGDFLAREEGDNFIALINRGWTNPQEARKGTQALAEKMLRQLDRPLNLGEHQAGMTACAGIVIYPDDASAAEQLLARAQATTTTAKRMGRGKIQLYSAPIGEEVASKFSLEGQLRKALLNDDLEIHFQPQFRAKDSRITGAEALVRWPDGEGGYISNSKFIPVAEDAGLILQLDHYVLQTLCDQALMWANELPPGFRLGFNFSAIGFQEPSCVTRIIETIHKVGLPAHRFELEVTEQAVMTDFSAAIEKLVALRSFGLSVALDDFGTGYSSLAYLQQMPLDRLKVDRTFIREVESNRKAGSIALAIFKLARTLGLDCLVEGVETAAQLKFCRLNHAQHIQGFYLSRPLPPDELLARINQPAQKLN